MTQAAAKWSLEGDYFENCNCDFLCPCLFAPSGPMTVLPTEGFCDVMLAVHIDRGDYGGVALNGLNVVIGAHADGVMSSGGWKVALHFDERANDQQREALGAIFSGNAGGPMGAFAPLIGEVVGNDYVPITYTQAGRHRAVNVPGQVDMSIDAVPSMNPDSEIWVAAGHPFAPDKLSLATGAANSTYNAFGLSFDNSGKNGHYAPIRWANA